MRLQTRANRMVFFAGFRLQRDWILERNKEVNRYYKAIAPNLPHLHNRYTEKFII